MSKCQRALNDDSCLMLLGQLDGRSVAPGTDGNSTPTAARSPNAFCFAAGASQAALCVPMRGVGLAGLAGCGGVRLGAETQRRAWAVCMLLQLTPRMPVCPCLCALTAGHLGMAISASCVLKTSSVSASRSKRASACYIQPGATGNKQLPPSLPDQWHATAQCYQIWEICIRGKQDQGKRANSSSAAVRVCAMPL
jgi:hypothetical protein